LPSCANPGNPGSAGNPSTFACETVTPGGSYPIVVGSGSAAGQVTVNWNPQ
jgi:hypothetical protein